MKYSIEQARLISGYSPRQLAQKLNLTEKMYMAYETYQKPLPMEIAYEFSRFTKIRLDFIDFKPQNF